jgi:hypothetical protein
MEDVGRAAALPFGVGVVFWVLGSVAATAVAMVTIRLHPQWALMAHRLLALGAVLVTAGFLVIHRDSHRF